MKLRWRLMIALAVAGLLPLVPLYYTVHSTVDMALRALAPRETGEALNSGVAVTRQALRQLEAQLELRLEAIRRTVPLPPEPVAPDLSASLLDSTETLFADVDGTHYRLRQGTSWQVASLSLPGESSTFKRMPSEVTAKQQDRRATWTLEHTLPSTMTRGAELIQQGAAGWALRSMERDRIIGSLMGTYVLAYLLAMVLAVIAGQRVVVPMTRQVEDLTGVAQQVREGHEELRASTTGSGEVARLAVTFNLMLDRLHESRRKAAEMEKMAAWRELARVLAHEIKNPLTPIQLSVQQLCDSYEGDDDRYARLAATTREIVDEEIESLRKLTREFSDFARAPRPNFDLASPEALARDIASLYRESAESDLDTLPGEFYLDREKLKRAVINLLDNAIAAAGGEGTVRFSLKADSGSFRYVVEDSGPGVPDDQRERVFEPYFTTKSNGVGLGLPLVKTTCEQHGGGVTLDRSPELGGARFTLTVPLHATPPATEESDGLI